MKFTKQCFSLAQLILVVAILCLLAAMAIPARAQVTATTSVNCISNPIVIQTVTSNLTSSQYAVQTVRQGRNLGIGMQYYGANATNTGTVGFQFGLKYGTNTLLTTTKPITLTSAANGTTTVIDWGVIPAYTIGPADSIVLLGVTNNTFTGSGVGNITISNVFLQWQSP
jgi:hypothetical protein